MTARATVTPRLLPAPDAAHYLGVSVTTLNNLEIPRRKLGKKRLYDRLILDSFVSDLPLDQEEESGENSCDKAFGLGT